MEFQVDPQSVVKATDAKIFLEHKLSYLQLRFMKIQSALQSIHSADPGVTRLLSVFQDTIAKQERTFASLKKELSQNLKDYSGYAQPPVLAFNTLFREMDASHVRPYEEGQYVLGSLSDEGFNEVTQLCSQIFQSQLSVKKLEQDVQTLLPAKDTNALFSQMLKFPEFAFPSSKETSESGGQEAGFHKIEQFMEQWILRLQETEERVQAKQEKLAQKEKQVLKKETSLETQSAQQQQRNADLEERHRQLSQKEQQLLEQQIIYKEKNQQLAQLQAELDLQQKAIRQQQQSIDNDLKQLRARETQWQLKEQALEQREVLLTQKEAQIHVWEQTARNQHNPAFTAEQQSLLQQQRDLLRQMEQERERLEGEKKWVKGLLGKLLEQHEVMEQAQEKLRHAENDTLQRQEDMLRQEKGWIKVEKSKINRAQADTADTTDNHFEDIF